MQIFKKNNNKNNVVTWETTPHYLKSDNIKEWQINNLLNWGLNIIIIYRVDGQTMNYWNIRFLLHSLL